MTDDLIQRATEWLQLHKEYALPVSIATIKLMEDMVAEIERLHDTRTTIVEVPGHAGKAVAAPCCIDGCQYGEIERLHESINEMAKELHEAINEPMYSGTRNDWKYRAQAAEAALTRLEDAIWPNHSSAARNSANIVTLAQCHREDSESIDRHSAGDSYGETTDWDAVTLERARSIK